MSCKSQIFIFEKAQPLFVIVSHEVMVMLILSDQLYEMMSFDGSLSTSSESKAFPVNFAMGL